MNISIDASTLDRVSDKFGDRSEKIKTVIGSIIKKAAFVVERHGKFYSPVDTGRMRASITEGVVFQERSAQIGPTVTYAKFVHARIPFMTAAATQSIPEITKIAQKEISEAIK